MGMDVKGVMNILENLYGEGPFYLKSQISHAIEEYNNLIGTSDDTITVTTEENDSKIKVNVILEEVKTIVGFAEIELDYIESENKGEFHKRLEDTINYLSNHNGLPVHWFTPDSVVNAKVKYIFNGEYINDNINIDE